MLGELRKSIWSAASSQINQEQKWAWSVIELGSSCHGDYTLSLPEKPKRKIAVIKSADVVGYSCQREEENGRERTRIRWLNS